VTTGKAGSGTLRILDLTLIQRPNSIQQNNSTYVVFLPYPVRRSNDNFDDSLFFVLPLFLSLFPVLFTNLFFPVLLVLYGVANESKTASLPS
jgi:hypothetical protein